MLRVKFRIGLNASSRRSGSTSVASSLCADAHPLYTGTVNTFGASVSERTMRPHPRSVFLSFCLGPVMTIVVPFFTGQLREGDFGDMISNVIIVFSMFHICCRQLDALPLVLHLAQSMVLLADTDFSG